MENINLLKRRNFMGRFLRMPKLFLSHYAILRKKNGVRDSLFCAVRLSIIVLK